MSFTLQNSDDSPYPLGLISYFSDSAGDFTVFVENYAIWGGSETNMKLTCVSSQAQAQISITHMFKIVVGIYDDGS